jgi:lysophospholipase L1-like esterase
MKIFMEGKMKGNASRRLQVVFSVLVVVILIFTSTAPTSAAVLVPNSMAALGDSITQAYNSRSFLASSPTYSWSTGSVSTVNSMYSHFLIKNPAISGKNYNYSVVGAKMAGLSTQASKVPSTIEYVTILMGANDVCTSSDSNMTGVTLFRSQFQTAMATLTKRAPNARIYVVSIPNIYNLWDVLKSNSSARLRWSLYGICQSMLKNPTSSQAADVARREKVKMHNEALNGVLKEVCASYSAKCTFDNNAAYNTVFVPSDVSTLDYFHPSVAGQAKLANAAWLASGFAP